MRCEVENSDQMINYFWSLEKITRFGVVEA